MDRRTFCALAAAPGLTIAATKLWAHDGPLRGPASPAAEPVYPSFTTWAPQEFTCPLSKTKNTFQAIMSFGTYFYQWPSKYQLIFWPFTDSNVLYSCKKCHLTTFMGDFADIPKDKLEGLRQLLKAVTLPAAKEYTEIPMSDRLIVAEKVYRAMGQTDDDFWSHFYRVAGYHYHGENKAAEADGARRKALEIVTRQLAVPTADGRKSLIYISAAMHHFLREDAAALKDFELAKNTKYAVKDLDEQRNANGELYLNKLTDEYLELIKQKKYPRDAK